MDFAASPNSNLNTPDFIESNHANWPDQELVCMLIDGVQFKANLPLQFVLGPHLTSLPNANLVQRMEAALEKPYVTPVECGRWMPQLDLKNGDCESGPTEIDQDSLKVLK